MTRDYDIALRDVTRGLISWRMWGRFGWQEVKRRYRRTVIGPFWTTISLGIFIVTLGFLWARLWNQDARAYLPYLSAGLVTWTMISTIISEGCSTFLTAESIMKQLQFPYSLLTLSIVWRNLIIFFHNLLIYLLVMLYAHIPLNWNTLLVVPGLLFVCATGMWVTLFLGMLCARYRDVTQVIVSLLQIATFVTPIFYSPTQLTGKTAKLAELNVLYHYIDVVRSPLLGLAPAMVSYEVVIAVTVLGWIFTLYTYARFRRRIPYWL